MFAKIKSKYAQFKESDRVVAARVSAEKAVASVKDAGKASAEHVGRHPYAYGGVAMVGAIGAALAFKGPLLAKAAVYVAVDLSATALIAYAAARSAVKAQRAEQGDVVAQGPDAVSAVPKWLGRHEHG